MHSLRGISLFAVPPECSLSTSKARFLSLGSGIDLTKMTSSVEGTPADFVLVGCFRLLAGLPGARLLKTLAIASKAS